MDELTGRLKREQQTLECMTAIFCHDHHPLHADGGLCSSCSTLMRYAEKRLAKCPYGQSKPTCAKCPIHCYKKQQREQVRQMMRYAGPRMPWRQPWRALVHIFDKLRHVVHPMELRRNQKR